VGVKVRGELLLRKKLMNTGTAINKAAADALRAGARRIRDRARDYAPVEYGNLEDSIKLQEENRSQNTWNEIVYIDRTTPAPERGEGAIVGDYAVYAHEGIVSGTKGGGIGQGPASIAKAQRLGVEVGPKFLERAFNENVARIRQEVIDATKQAITSQEEASARKALAQRLLTAARSARGSTGPQRPSPVMRPRSSKKGRGRKR
jgi:hypothetical protein